MADKIITTITSAEGSNLTVKAFAEQPPITVKTLTAGPGVSTSIYMRNILDVNSAAISDGRILIYDSATSNHIYIDRFDSTSTSGLVDSAYVQLRQIKYSTADFTDSAYVTGLPVSTFNNDANYLDSTTVQNVIDATYVQSNQITYNTSNFTDSAYVASVLPTLGGDYVDSAYVASVLPTLGGDYVDSAYVTSVLPTLGNDFVDSAYVTSLPVSTFTNDANYLDSTTVTGVINSSYVQTNQITYNTSDFTDSAFVSSSISTAINNLIDGAPGTLDTLNEIAAALNDDDSAVNSLITLINAKDSDFVKSAANQAWIQSQQIIYTTADFTDSAYVASVLPTLGGDYVDSSYVTGLPISTFSNDANYLDSTTVTGVIDQTYIQSNQITYSTADFTDSAYVTSVLPTLGNDYVDSAYVTSVLPTLGNDYVDSAYVTSVLPTLGGDYVDSAYVISVLPTLGGDYVDSAYVTSLPVSTFTNDANYLDSTTVTGVIDQTYVQNNQIKYTTADFADSAYVQSVLPTLGNDYVDSAYVTSVLPTFGNDYVDSAYVTGLPVSTFTNDANYLDSTTVQGVINSSYIQTNQITYNTSDFTDSAYVSGQITAAIDALIDGAPGTLDTLNEIAAALNDNDSAYATLVGLINDQLDSAEAIALIDSAYVQARQITYNTSDFTDSAFVTSLPVSTFSNDANYLDSTTVTGVIDQTYVQNNQIKYTTADFADSAYVTSVLPTLGNDYVDSAYVTSVLPTLGGDYVDSAYVTSLPVSTFTNDANYLDSTTVQGVIDQTYIQNNQIKYTTADFTDSAYVTSVLPTLGGDYVDSAYVTSVLPTLGNDYVDSAYVTGLPVSTFNNDANYLDSTTVTGVINSAYIQTNQITYNTSDFTDSAFVSTSISTAISSLVDGAPTALDTLNEIASALQDDSNAIAALVIAIDAKDSDFVKSAADQAWIQSQQITYTTADFTDSAYVLSVLPTLGGDYVDSAYVQSVLPTLGGDYLDSSTVTTVIDQTYIQNNQIKYTTADFTDSAYVTGLPVSTFNNDANYLDSTTVLGVIDQTYVQNNQIKYTTADFTDSAFVTGLPVSTFANDANYLDSTTVTGVIDATYIQNNQIKYTTADFTDSAYVLSVLPTLGGDYVDSAYVTSLPVSTFSNDANYLDSTTVTGVIDATYVQNNQIKYTTADFTDSAYVTSVLPTLGNDYVDSAQVSSIIIADVVKSFIDALNINAAQLGGHDSGYFRLNVYDSAGVLLN